MPEDLYRMARTMRSLGAGDPFEGGGGQYSRENPVENALAARMNYFKQQVAPIQLNALREQEREQAAFKNALSGIDMEKPDFGKIISAAPQIGLKFMHELTGLKTQDRLVAASKAKEGMEWLQSAMGQYYHSPEPEKSYAEIIANGKAMGLNDATLALVPNPQQFQTPEARRGAIGMVLAPMEGLKSMAEMAKQDAITTREQQKTAGKVSVANIKRASTLEAALIRLESAKRTSTSGAADYYDEEKGEWHTLRMDAEGNTKDVKQPQGYVPKEVVKQQMITERAANKNQDISAESEEKQKTYRVKNKKTGQYEDVSEEQYNKILNYKK